MHYVEMESVQHPVLRRPIALLSLPNTGTDWFVHWFLQQNPGLRYYREFFNPICNPTYENELNRAFGCEMVDNYAMMAKSRIPLDTVLAKTWAKEKFNFTKENYSAFKLYWFVSHFDCFVLYRRAELSLPGSRLQVKSWYDAMFGTLLKNKWSLGPDVRVLFDYALSQADTLSKRQVAAFVIHYYQLLKSAYRLGVPVIDYEQLMRQPTDDLADYLHGLPGVLDAERLAHDLSADRRPGHKDFSALKADTFFHQIVELALRCGGESVSALAQGQRCTTTLEFAPDAIAI